MTSPVKKSPSHWPTGITAPGVSLGVYKALARRPWPRTYRGKIMLVAFLGTHVPLLTLLCLAIAHTGLSSHDKMLVLLVSLVATLVGTGATLLLLNHLLAPILLTAHSLRCYQSDMQLPALPTHFTDEAGILMADTVRTVEKLDATIRSLKGCDLVTGLPNRDRFQEYLRHEVATGLRYGKSFSVLVVEVNEESFSSGEANFGQGEDDRMLCEVVRRLQSCVRDADLLSRVGSNRFALLHHDASTPEDILRQSQRILDALKRPLLPDGVMGQVSTSIGIALFLNSESNGSELLENAESAVRVARQRGGDKSQFFAAETNERLRQRLALGDDIQGALERGEFVLHYQPRINSATKQIAGVEALVRWQHPTRGFISPTDFIPIAEATGLITPLGEWILRTACARNKSWQSEGLPQFPVTVNLMRRHFQHPDLVEKIGLILEETGLDAQFLELEVSERLVTNDVENVIGLFQKLRAVGLQLSLCNFRAGRASLSRIRQLPLHSLKIDRSFVQGLTGNDEEADMIPSIIGLANALGLIVIAEGIETHDQDQYLRNQGCHKLQGFFYSRPLDAPACTRFIKRNAPQTALILETLPILFSSLDPPSQPLVHPLDI